MDSGQEKDLLHDVFSRERWLVSLERFIQVLRINIFVADAAGEPLVHPCATAFSEDYGCRLLTRLLDLDEVGRGKEFLRKFSPYGDYLEYKSKLNLHVFAVPLRIYGRLSAYMVIGPIIMNKRLSDDEYMETAKQEGLYFDGLLDEMHGLRVVSHLAMCAILDLLAAISKDFIDIGMENRRLRKAQFSREVLSGTVRKAAEDLYKEIHFDELLISVLDVALRLTGAECGSIMVIDKDGKDLRIRVSRGLGSAYARNVRLKIGEGVAGLAAQENNPFFIKGQGGAGCPDRIKPFLNRSDIKESVVMPIASSGRVFGVMNLHSKIGGSHIEENAEYLLSLSRLLSTAAVF